MPGLESTLRRASGRHTDKTEAPIGPDLQRLLYVGQMWRPELISRRDGSGHMEQAMELEVSGQGFDSARLSSVQAGLGNLGYPDWSGVGCWHQGSRRWACFQVVSRFVENFG